MATNGIPISPELVEAQLVCCLMLYMSDPSSDALNDSIAQVLQLGLFNRQVLDSYLTTHASFVNSTLPLQGNMNLPYTTDINSARDQFNELLINGNVTCCNKKIGENDTNVRRVPPLCWISQHFNTLAFQQSLGDLLKNKSFVPFMIYAIVFFENQRAASSLRHGGGGHHVCAGVLDINHSTLQNYFTAPGDPHVPLIPIAQECDVDNRSNCTNWRYQPNAGINNMAGGNLSLPPTDADRDSDAYLYAQPNFETSSDWTEIIARVGMQCWNDILEWCE